MGLNLHLLIIICPYAGNLNSYPIQKDSFFMGELCVFCFRYRHAAVHGKGLLSPSEKQSRPRSGCTGAFVDSELVAERTDFQMQINEW